MNNQIVKINNTDLSVKEFKGQRVVTFKDIDMLHERVEGTAGRNFRENKNHLIENEDYFLIKGDELREFKQATNFVGSNAKEIILITESGYLMLVKSLQDDLAWKVQRELVNNYFRVKEIVQTKQLSNFELANQMMNIMQNTQIMAQVVQGLNQGMIGIQQYVQDSIQAKDHQIDQAMELIGLRSKNVSSLISKLKEELYKRNRELVQANDIEYLKAKNKIFKEFKVTKWEEIPIGKYNAVFAYIEEVI